MKALLLTTFAACLLSAAVSSQTPSVALPRASVQLNTAPLLNRAYERASLGNARIVVPPERQPAMGPGLHPTALLAYALWVERVPFGANFQHNILFSRSTDGGFSWSAPTQIFSVQTSSGAWDFEQLAAAATGHQIYVALSTGSFNQATQSAWPNDLYLLASPDEGANWLAAQRVNTATAGLGDVDSVRIAASQGKAHIAYHFAHFTTGTTQGPNDMFYVGAEIKNGALNLFRPEIRLNNTSAPIGQAVVRYVAIAACGDDVACVWGDAREGASNPRGNLYVALSNDGGLNFIEKRLTSYDSANLRNGTYWEPDVAVTKGNIYICFGHAAGTGSRLESTAFIYSNDSGKNFSAPINLSPGAAGFDIDAPRLAADADLVSVIWRDDRDGRGNTANMVYAAADDQGGKGFLAQVKEFRLDEPTPGQVKCENYDIVVRGDRIVIVYEVNPTSGGEDIHFVVSLDRGKSFGPPRPGTQIGALYQGTFDVNDPRVCMTGNGDLLIWWADNRASAYDLHVSGLKLPELSYLGGSKGFRIDGFVASDEGSIALVLVTEAGTSPYPLDAMGFTLNFTPGLFTPLFAGFPQAYAALVTNGSAHFPVAPDGLGIFHAVGVGIDPSALRFSWFTDPVTY